MLPIHDIEDSLSLWIKERPALEARYGSPHREQLDQDLRTATFLTRRDETEEEPAGFHFAHTSLQEYFLAEYLLAAAREDRAELWQMQIPAKRRSISSARCWRWSATSGRFTICRHGRRDRNAPSTNSCSPMSRAPAARTRRRLSLRGLNLSGGDYERHRFADLDLAGAQFRGARRRG